MSFGFGFSLPAYTEYGGRFGAGATLLLDFTSGNQTLDSRITFTRTTTATRTNSSGVIESVAINGPRFDYNPTTLAPNGLLIEEQRTNSIRNNTMVGAAVGTPGTLPTNWQRFVSGAAATAVVSVGTESGIAYIDVQFTGGNGDAISFFIDGTTGHAAVNGQTWTGSVYYRLIAGSFANISACNQAVYEANSSGTALVATSTVLSGVTSAGLATQRIAVTRTNNNASTALEQLALNFSGSGGSFDITLRIGLPQLELGAFATSVIPTSTAATTRTADVATMTGTNFSSWYNATEGTLYAEGKSVNSISGTTARRYAEINDGTANGNIISVTFRNTTQSRFSVNVSNVAQASITSGGTIDQFSKIAGAYVVNDFAFCANGTLGTQDTSGTIPVVTQLTIGNTSVSSSAASINGTIKQIAFYPRRLADSELQAITS
jgi:hypothetical protein